MGEQNPLKLERSTFLVVLSVDPSSVRSSYGVQVWPSETTSLNLTAASLLLSQLIICMTGVDQ